MPNAATQVRIDPTLTPPPPAAALMTLATSKGMWSGFDFHWHDFPVLGTVLLCDVKVVLSEHQRGLQPELSMLVTWMKLPGRPFQATQAFAFRAAMTISDLIDQDAGQVYRDQMQIQPRTAWALMTADDPHSWYQAMLGGVQEPLPFQPT